MPIVRCPDPAAVRTTLDTMKQAQGSALFLFFGSEDPVTGESWCPDCVTADPVLRSACVRLRPDLILHECPVGLRSDWKGKMDHPYRVDPDLRLARIPTLILFVGGIERGRLVEADCANPETVAAFLAK
jgi:hypothetical protein